MKRLKLIRLGIVAVVTPAVLLLSAAAYALPELLGQGANEEFKGKNTARIQTLETVAKEKLECTAMAVAGKQTNDTTGTFAIDFTGCRAITSIGNFACNTSGDAKEVVLSTGTADYVSTTQKGTDSAALLLLPTEVTIECTALVKLKVRGHLLCPFSFPLTISKSHTASCSQSFGKQTDQIYFNDEEFLVSLQHLEVSKNGGAFEEAGESASFFVEFIHEVAFMNE